MTGERRSVAALRRDGMIVTPPPAPSADPRQLLVTVDQAAGVELHATPHPLDSPDLQDTWLLQVIVDGVVDDEIVLRPAELPALRRMGAMISAAVQDLADEHETSL
jgi:hypothetical protein